MSDNWTDDEVREWLHNATPEQVAAFRVKNPAVAHLANQARQAPMCPKHRGRQLAEGGYCVDCQGFPLTNTATSGQSGAEATARPLITSEKMLMAQITRLAKSHGWLVYHTYDSRKSEFGFPDLVLVSEARDHRKHGRVIFAELKTEMEITTDAQDRWLSRLARARAEVYIWRPSDWPDIARILEDK